MRWNGTFAETSGKVTWHLPRPPLPAPRFEGEKKWGLELYSHDNPKGKASENDAWWRWAELGSVQRERDIITVWWQHCGTSSPRSLGLSISNKYFLLTPFRVGLFLSLAIEASLIRHEMAKSHRSIWGQPRVPFFHLKFPCTVFTIHMPEEGVTFSPREGLLPVWFAFCRRYYFPGQEIVVGSQMCCLLSF